MICAQKGSGVFVSDAFVYMSTHWRTTFRDCTAETCPAAWHRVALACLFCSHLQFTCMFYQCFGNQNTPDQLLSMSTPGAKKIYVGDQVLDNVGDVCCSIVQPFAVLFQLFFCAPGACDGRGAGRASWAVGLCASLHISAPAATMFKHHESSDIFDGGGSCIYVPTTIHAWTVDSSFSCKPPAACHALSEFAATLNSGTTREQDRVQVDLCVGS